MRWLVVTLAIGCGSSANNGPPGDDTSPGDDATTGDSSNDGSTINPDAPPSPIDPNCVDTWCVETSPIAGVLLKSVWAVSSGDVYAVGDGGLILRRQNGTWTQQTSNTTANLRGVWAANGNDVWAIGEGGTILRSNGTTWEPATAAFTSDFKSIWGSGPNDVWIAAFGRVLRWDGSAFADTKTANNANPSGLLLSVHGTGPDDVWTTGEDARVRQFTTAWSNTMNPGGGNSYFAVHAIGGGTAIVSGFLETRHGSGTNWTSHANGSSVFQAFYSTSATDVWAAGGTKVGHWNGATWSTEQPAGAAGDFFGVTGAGVHVWVVGSESLILHRN